MQKDKLHTVSGDIMKEVTEDELLGDRVNEKYK